MPVVNANSVDPDQTLHSAASDLGLIWVYIVCQCPIYGMLGTNGLKAELSSRLNHASLQRAFYYHLFVI